MKTINPVILKDEKKIYTVVSLPDTPGNYPVVIMVHGGPGGSKSGPGNLFGLLTDILVSKNIGTIRFDFLGEGDSDGDYVDMTFANQRAEYLKVLDYARQQGYKKLGLLGDSYGGATAIAEFSNDIKCLALVWPTIDLLDTSFKTYLSSEKLNELNQNGFIKEGEKRIGKEFIKELQGSKNILHQVRNINVPTLIIHGNADVEVPYHQSEAIYEQLSEPKKLIIIEGGGHAITDADKQPMIIENIVDWFVKYM